MGEIEVGISPDLKRARYQCCITTCKAIVADLRQQHPYCAEGYPTHLDDEFVSGPASNCPKGLWEKLEPVTAENAAADARDALRDHISTRLLNGLRPLITGLILAKGGVEGATATLATAAKQHRGGVELWIIMTVVSEMVHDGLISDKDRFLLLSACVGELQAVAEVGKALAYYGLRCCVEAGACSQAQAESVASAWAIQEPENVR